MTDAPESIFTFSEENYTDPPAAQGDDDAAGGRPRPPRMRQGRSCRCTVTIKGDFKSATGEGTWTSEEVSSWNFHERGLNSYRCGGKWRVNGDNIDFHVEQFEFHARPNRGGESREGQVISRPAAEVRNGSFSSIMFDSRQVTRQQ